jgi:hypothetical protein
MEYWNIGIMVNTKNTANSKRQNPGDRSQNTKPSLLE